MKEKMKNFFQKISALGQRIPEFSDKNYTLASYIFGGLLSLASIFFIYEMFTVDEFGFDVNWNIFKSFLLMPLYLVGLLLAFANWGRFIHWSGKPVYKDQDGNVYRNDDIVDNLFFQLLLPILGHFVIEPLLYACLIYYPIVCVLAILSSILPYVITLVLIAISVFTILSSRYLLGMRYRSLILVLISLVGSSLLLWSAIRMESGKESLPEPVEQFIDSELVEPIEALEGEQSDLDLQEVVEE